jgi:uncharacterized protein (TIGR02145 family)
MDKKSSIGLFSLILMFLLLISCNKKQNNIYVNMDPWPVYGSLADQDGNNYKTRIIGTQTWMAENLKTTKFNDGTPIPVVTDASSWNNLSGPACCWQSYNPDYKVKYGVLYNWYTVETKNLCPKGWHVPTNEEWTQLIDYLGGEMTAGGRLKETGFRHWLSPNSGATDEEAFRALPGGSFNLSDTVFNSIREVGYWWTTSTNTKDLAISWLIYNSTERADKSFSPKKSGLSVRCMMNY